MGTVSIKMLKEKECSVVPIRPPHNGGLATGRNHVADMTQWRSRWDRVLRAPDTC